MMSRKNIQLVLTLAMLALVLLIIVHEFSWLELQQQLQALDPYSLVALLVLTAATRVPQAEAMRTALHIFDKHVTFMDSFWVIAIKAFFNQIFAGAGLMAQALRLKVSHAVPLPVFVAVTWVQLLAQLFAVAATGFLVGILYARAAQSVSPVLSALPWLGLFAIGVLLLHLPRGLLRMPIIGVRLQSVSQSFSAIAPGNRQLAHVAGLFVVVLLIRAARLGLIVALIAPEIPVAAFLFAFMVGELALIAPVTPGGIGTRELLLGAGAIGVGAETIILAGLVDRAAAITVTLTLGAVALLRPTRDAPVT